MIYNIAGKVFYANGQITNAVYAFNKAKSLGSDDLLYLGLSYLKLFQRYVETRYLHLAIRAFTRIKHMSDRVKKILDVLGQEPEIKEFIMAHLGRASKQSNKQPIIDDMYNFLKERGIIYSSKSIERYWNASLRYPVKDPVMLAQMVIYSLHKRKPLSDIDEEELHKQEYYPLEYNPKKLPNVVRRYLDRIFTIDYEIYMLSLLSKGALGEKIKVRKESLQKYLNKLYHPLHVYLPQDKFLVLYSNIIKSLRSLTPKEKWELLDKY